MAEAGWKSWCQSVDAPGWSELQDLLHERFHHKTLLFRGHSDESWNLEPTLERVTKKQFPRSGVIQLPPSEHEKSLIYRFQRRAHQYISNPPADHALVDWLALMQHHGAPTRLLDWTLSPYVALYFALEEAKPGQNCCIWAVDGEGLREAADRHDLAYELEVVRGYDWLNEQLLLEDNPTIIVEVNPARMNERVAAQQGVFLCNLGFGKSFNNVMEDIAGEYNGLVEAGREPDGPPLIRVITIRHSLRVEMLTALNRMNINRASLFPGLDGFSRSLRMGLELELDDEFRHKDFAKRLSGFDRHLQTHDKQHGDG
jgi:hypothetical protein